MAKKSKRNPRKKKQAMDARAEAETPEVTRRSVLKLARNGGIAAAALAGGGYAAVSSYQGYLAEHDLSRIGDGKPVVVQVHDPTCPTCTALQRETRAAMRQFGECDLVYLIADIKQPEGAAFALLHNVPHVTLVLFDGNGQVQQKLTGMRYQAELSTVLAAHFQTHRARS